MKQLIIKILELINYKNLKYVLYLMIGISIILTIYNLFNLTTIGIFFLMNILAVTLGIFSYIIIKPNNKNKIDPIINYEKIYIIIIIFFALLSFSSLLAYFSITYRSLLYFIFLSFTFFIIAFQILFLNLDKKLAKIILFEIILIVIINKISIYFINYELAWWDTFFHYTVIYNTFYTNQLPPSDTNWGAFGLFHAFNTIVLKILFNEINTNYIYVDLLIIFVIIIFAYYITYRISKSFKAGLFASILASILLPDPHFTPHPFSFMLFLISIYLLYNTIINQKLSRKMFLLLILLSFSSFLYHPSSGLFLSIIFITMNIILFLLRNLNKLFPYIYLIVTISYLIYVTGYFFEFFIRRLTLPTPYYAYYEYLAGGKSFHEFISYYIFSHIYYPVIIYFASLAIPYLILNKNLKNYYLPIIITIAFMFPFILLIAYRTSEQVIGTWLITFMATLIGGVSISTLSNIAKKRILSTFLILITLAFFVFILNTDDNPYFDKYSNPFTRAHFGTDSMHKAREFIEVLPKDKNFTAENWILEHAVGEYDIIKGESRPGFKHLYMVELDKAHEIIFIFSKYGIERNGAYHYKPLFINNFINKIKEKEANILLNSDNVIILQK
jgi:hypothetical protein